MATTVIKIRGLLGYQNERITGKPHVGALIIRVGFGSILYHDCNKEPQKPYSNY